jgi:ABC-type glycerol-3-phosphate transport system permease component
MRRLATSGKYASLVLASLVVLVPLVVVLFASFKTHAEYSTTGPLTPPRDWLNFGNFATAWTGGKMLRGFVNTTIILVVSARSRLTR